MTARATAYPAERYIASGFRSVHGWIPALALQEVACFSQLQRRLGIRGPVCEIGIHHGRMLILLQLLTEPDELSVGIDLHEQTRLLHNLRAHGGNPARLKTITDNSLQVSAERVLESCQGRPRLFSLDGGRTVDTTHHDMSLALNTLCAGGVVFVDDYFQERWPEVSEGVCRFMLREGGLSPIAIGGNKLFFTNSVATARDYRDGLGELFPGQIRPLHMFGAPVLQILPLTLRRRISRNPLWRFLRSRVL